MKLAKNETFLENLATTNGMSIYHTDFCGRDCGVYTSSGVSSLEVLPVAGISHDDAGVHIVRVAPCGSIQQKVILWDDLQDKRVQESFFVWLSRERPETAIDMCELASDVHRQPWEKFLGLVAAWNTAHARQSWWFFSPVVDWSVTTGTVSGYQQAAHLANLILKEKLEELLRCQRMLFNVVASGCNQ